MTAKTENETVTLDRDVYIGILWMLAGHLLTSLHDDWLGWWILTPLAATAQTLGLIRLVVYAFRARRKEG